CPPARSCWHHPCKANRLFHEGCRQSCESPAQKCPACLDWSASGPRHLHSSVPPARLHPPCRVSSTSNFRPRSRRSPLWLDWFRARNQGSISFCGGSLSTVDKHASAICQSSRRVRQPLVVA